MKPQAGQVAVVTGAANGIGLALTEALRARGLRVVLADIEAETVERVAAEFGSDVIAVPTDVADTEQVDALATETMRQFGRVDLLFNNAGIGGGGLSWDIDAAEWQRVWAVNVAGVTNGLRAFLPHMIEAGRGHIVNTSSLAAFGVAAFNAPYGASKHAIVGISESLHTELAVMAPDIGVTVVCPGPVDTQMLRGLTDALISPASGVDRRRQVDTGWLGDITAEQRARLEPGLQMTAAMNELSIPAAQAAEIILGAVEAGRLYVTTYPETAASVRERTENIVADFLAPGV